MVQIVRRARRRVWSIYSNAQRVSSLHLSKGCLNPVRSKYSCAACPKTRTEPKAGILEALSKLAETSRRGTGSAIGAPEQTSHSSSYCQPSLDTSHPKRPGAPVLSSFVFLDTTRSPQESVDYGVHFASRHGLSSLSAGCSCHLRRPAPTTARRQARVCSAAATSATGAVRHPTRAGESSMLQSTPTTPYRVSM